MFIPSYCSLFCCFALRVLSVCGSRVDVLYCHSAKIMVHKEHIIYFTIVEQIYHIPKFQTYSTLTEGFAIPPQNFQKQPSTEGLRQ